MVKRKKNSCPISVIMPVYNDEKYLSESIPSILNQTFDDFEFIIIDDCSIDNSWDIIQTFSDDRILIIRNEKNMGMSPTLNFGIGMAKGKYVAVMDADSVALSDRLWKQYDYMENNPAILALGAQCDFSGLEHKTMAYFSYWEICAGLLYNNCVLHASMFIRSNTIEHLGGYNERYSNSFDYDLVCRISLTGKIENLTDICLICHRSPDQILTSETLEQKKYTDEIRRQYQIAFINGNKSTGLSEVGETETGYSDMGRVIGLYVMGECFDKSFRNRADKLLDDIFDNIDSSTPLCVKNGLLGIGAGLIYLLRNHFVEGDEDEVLASIDAAVFRSTLYYEEDRDFDWEGIFYYLRKRASMPNSVNLSAQLSIKKSILQLLDIYKQHKDNKDVSKLERELDCYCENNLYKSLISVYRKNEHENAKIYAYERMTDTKSESASVTFVIPVRIDSEERRDNLSVIIEQLLSINEVEIIILEADAKSALEKQHFSCQVRHHFIRDEGPVFHRTKYLNKLFGMTQSPIVGVWDADVLVAKEQIEESIEQIRSGNALMSFPYDGRFYTLSPALSANFRAKRSYEIFKEQNVKLSMSFGTYSVGGAFFVNRDVYCSIGGENENFYGWGAEDNERVKRLEILEQRIHRSSGALYHLYHPRTNSHYNNLNNLKELIKVSGMSAEELTAYIKTWYWLDIRV